MRDGKRRGGVPPADCDARIRRLFDYWQSIHPAEGGLPGRRHVEPLHLPELLRWLCLIDVAREPLRFRYRLVGTGQVQALRRDLTGQWLDAALPGFERSAAYPDLVAVATGEIRYRRGRPDIPLEDSDAQMERLLLPLARDGASVDMILGMTLYRKSGGMLS